MKMLKHTLLALMVAAILSSCGRPEGNFPGSEYMPDMAHSIAYEANTYAGYSLNTWDSASVFTLKELANPKRPVPGTVPRGYAGVYYAQQSDQTGYEQVNDVLNGSNTINAIATPVNGSVPFYYGPSEEERTRAIDELIENPFPISEAGLAKGEELYNIYCGICHGEDAGGLGYLVAEDNPNVAYPAAPANLLLDEHVNASNGRYYFAIMYGKNVMGAYKDKLNYEERWQVIHYIRSLQASDRDLEYSAEANTLEPTYGTPMSEIETLAEGRMSEDPRTEPNDAGTSDQEMEGGDHSSDTGGSTTSGGQ